MKSTDILQALSLTKNKQTTNYCGKLANLFEFIKMVKDAILKAVIVETGLTINDVGKVLELKKVETDYKRDRLSHYRYNDSEVCEITKRECELRCQLSRITDLLWKKRKNKDNSELESERDNLRNELTELDNKKDALLAIEQTRLNGLTFDIAEMRKELGLFTGSKISIETGNGNYSFYLPIDNRFYYEVCRMLNLSFEVKDAVKKEVKHKFITFPYLIDNIKKSVGFISKDDLRPAMQCVCLDFSKEGLQVVTTDAHRMYYSKMVSFDGCKEDMQILIAPESVKPLSKLKLSDSEPLIITVFNDNTASFNGFEVNVLPDARFPQYRVVIPQYDYAMQFDKAELIKNVKKVLPYSNKATSQVNFHINGSISLHSEDVDFCFECDADMPYISKQIPDTDIAFNGKMLIECLGIFKDSSLKFKTDGKWNQAGIFTNDTDNVLLMPLMINN